MNESSDKVKLKPALALTVFAVAMGTNFGIYNSSVVNNLQPNVVPYINDTHAASWISTNPNTVWTFVISAFTAGTAVGTLISPFIADNFGRKKGLMFSGSCTVVGGILCACYLWVFELVLAGRLLQGVGMGIGLPLASSFITEITPVRFRGQFNALLQTAFGLGDLSGMVLATTPVLGSIDLSNYCFAITAIPSLFQVIVLIFSYDTPRHLVLKERKLTKGKKALLYYHGKVASVSAMSEILAEKGVPPPKTVEDGAATSNGLELSAKSQEKREKGNACSNLCLPEARKQILWACLLLTTNALTAVSVVMATSTQSFNNNDLPGYSEICTVTLGICNFVGSFIAVALMEKLGRKKLFGIGIYGAFASISAYTAISAILTYDPSITKELGYALVVSLELFLLFFSLVGATCNTLAAELCNQKFRSVALAWANFLNMAIATILFFLYNPFNNYLGVPWVYFPSSALSIVVGTYLLIVVPETAGKSLSDISSGFRKISLLSLH